MVDEIGVKRFVVNRSRVFYFFGREVSPGAPVVGSLYVERKISSQTDTLLQKLQLKKYYYKNLQLKTKPSDRPMFGIFIQPNSYLTTNHFLQLPNIKRRKKFWSFVFFQHVYFFTVIQSRSVRLKTQLRTCN